jgi:hypothetical protein
LPSTPWHAAHFALYVAAASAAAGVLQSATPAKTASAILRNKLTLDPSIVLAPDWFRFSKIGHAGQPVKIIPRHKRPRKSIHWAIPIRSESNLERLLGYF